jgi:hypothetical protein
MTQGAQQSSQKSSQDTSTKQKHRQPKRSDLVFHAVKTSKLVGAVMVDKRVPVIRKVAYIGIIGAMLVVLLFPEMFGDIVTALTPFLPLDLLGIPAEGAFDWVAFAVASFSLLKLFPAEIVGEHYDRLFRR